MTIANGMCVSFCNQPQAHFGLPWVRPWTIAVNVTLMKRGFNACQTHRSMYPSIFNRFPVIQPVAILAHFLHILASHGYTPGTIAVNVTWIVRKRLQCWSNAYTHLSSTVNKLARYWSEFATFPTPLAFNAPVRGVNSHWNSGKSLVLEN